MNKVREMSADLDSIVLSYEESLLRTSDVDLLHGPYWLNDNIISFFFEYLKNVLAESPHILFVSPEVTQCIKIISVSQVKEFLDPLESRQRRFLFFALNDNERPNAAGGSHWSLLVYSRADATVFHFDSFRGSNRGQAEQFAKKLFSYFDVKGIFEETTFIQQNNGYDCGIHVICTAEHLAKFLSRNGEIRQYNSLKEEVRKDVPTMRNQVVSIIKELRAEQQRFQR